MAEGASVPALGLSNKAVFADQPVDMYADKDVQPAANEQYTESSFRPLDLTGRHQNCLVKHFLTKNVFPHQKSILKALQTERVIASEECW